jgi:hypothetical protein
MPATADTEAASSNASGLKERTILVLVAELEQRGIRYAVMRNYEAYPAFEHDVDIVLHPNDVPAWQACLRALAQDLGWDALTRCHHWDSPYPHQSPKQFLLYEVSPALAFLCLDVFHGATLWGLPLYTADDVLADAVRDDLGFFRMSPARENLLRLLQVDALVGRHLEPEKVERYRGRIEEWWPLHGEETVALGRKLLGPSIEHGARQLLQGDFGAFKRHLRTARLTFLARTALRHPLASLDQVKARTRGRLREVGAGQCGFVTSAPAATEAQRRDVRQALDIVLATNAIREWTEVDALDAAVTSRERAEMEQGGLAVKWVRSHDAQELDLASSEEIAHKLIRLLIERHEIIWRREQAMPVHDAETRLQGAVSQ